MRKRYQQQGMSHAKWEVRMPEENQGLIKEDWGRDPGERLGLQGADGLMLEFAVE
jgi:hypothetical protein